MGDALIGFTGFVGSNLMAQRPFDHLYNSKNYREMEGRSYTQVVCAGTSAVKWEANAAPEKDEAQIRALRDVLETIEVQRFVLISTIDVYPVLTGVDEAFDCHRQENHAYGRHRLAFEDSCRDAFERCYVVRLPALFGRGLKKNILFDLLNDNQLEVINPASSFQYYDLANLWTDIERVIQNEVHLINLFTEPVRTSDLLRQLFPAKSVGEQAAPAAHYDLRTLHARLWGKDGFYAYSQREVMAQMKEFVAALRETGSDSGNR